MKAKLVFFAKLWNGRFQSVVALW